MKQKHKLFTRKTMISIFVLLPSLCILFSYLHQSTVDYFILRSSDLGKPQFCGSSEVFSCTKTLLSPLAQWADGVPVTELAIGYFTLLTLSLFWSRLKPIRPYVWTMGGSISIFYIAVMILFLRTICPPCLTVHLLHLGILGVSIYKEGFPRKRKSFGKIRLTIDGLWPIVLSLGLSGSIVVVYDYSVVGDYRKKMGTLRSRSFEEFGKISDAALTSLEQQSVSFFYSKEPNLKKIYLFYDFQCPYCKESLATLDTWKQGSGEEIDLRIIAFPLESSCNELYSGDDYSGSCLITDVFHCLVKNGKWEHYRDDLLKNRLLFTKDRKNLSGIRWGNQSVEEIVGECLTKDHDWLRAELKKDLALAETFGVAGTPVFVRMNPDKTASVFLGALSVEGWVRAFSEQEKN